MKEIWEAGKMKTNSLNRNFKNKKTAKLETHLHSHQELKVKKRLMSL
jgi:hypothetical protein